MDELTIAAINIVKGESNGDEYLWDYEDADKDGVITKGIWKSTLDERRKRNDGIVVPWSNSPHSQS